MFLHRFVIWCAAVSVSSALFAGPIPKGKPSSYPNWWFERDIIPRLDPANNSPEWPQDYPSPDDYGVVNLGQLKNIAARATEEFNSRLASPGAGNSANNLIHGWLSSPAPGIERDDYAAINQGQLKFTAKLFYDRLVGLGYRGRPLIASQVYPWTAEVGDEDSYAVANLGQLKNVFSFDVAGFLNDDYDHDDLTNGVEIALGTNLFDEDTDGDGIWDSVEVASGRNPLVAGPDSVITSISGLRLYLRADVGLVGDADAHIATWQDQSNLANSVWQGLPGARPEIVANSMNGLAALKFDGVDDVIPLPNIMAGETQGEVFIVTRLANHDGAYNGLAHFGTGTGTSYDADGKFHNDFGTSDAGVYSGPGTDIFEQTHIFNSSIDSVGTLVTRFNGRLWLTVSDRTVAFGDHPLLGSAYQDKAYNGYIAEVLVYDHVLTEAERNNVHVYLAGKYAPPGITAPGTVALVANALAQDRVSLGWTVASGMYQHLVATIERKVGTGAYSTVAVLADQISYTDTALVPGQTYTYRITVRNCLGDMAGSAPVDVTLPTAPPASPVYVPAANLRLWLRPGIGQPASGSVAVWGDQSGLGNDAIQEDPALQPQIIPNVLNGLPVVRFNGENALQLPAGLMSDATAGEIIALLRVGDKRPGIYKDGYNTLWDFGQASGYTYTLPGASTYLRYNGFGLEQARNKDNFPRSLVSAYHIHDTSSQDGLWTESYNGQLYESADDATVHFGTVADLGRGFVGDFVEILVYDRVLTSQERGAAADYLSQKYSLASRDSAAPSKPTNLSVSNLTANSFTLSWAAASDNVGVTSYNIYRDNILVGSTAGGTLYGVVGGMNPETSHVVFVEALDAQGNVSLPSEPLTVTTLADTYVPSTPTDLVASFVGANRFTMAWTPSTDDMLVAGYEVFRDGAKIATTASASITINGLSASTTYSMTVRAYDSSGNYSAQSNPLPVTTSDYNISGNGSVSPPPPFVAVRALALGMDFAVGLSDDGTAKSWGSNSSLQLGISSSVVTLLQPIPTTIPVPAAVGVTNIYAGRQHGFLLTRVKPTVLAPSPADVRALMAWGLNSDGQLGLGNTTNRSAPVAVPNFTNVLAASAGEKHSLAIKSDGTLWSWGNNGQGRLGLGSTGTAANYNTPQAVSAGVSGFIAVAAGYDHSLALKADGTVWAWGANTDGQLGVGDYNQRTTPTQLTGISTGTGSVVPMIVAGRGFSALLSKDGSVRVWGANDKGQLGAGSSVLKSNQPIQLSVLGTGVRALAAGESHVLALLSDRTVQGWGLNSAGQLGKLTPTTSVFTPGAVPDLADVEIIAAGGQYSAYGRLDGSILVAGMPVDLDTGFPSGVHGPAELGYRSTRVQIRDVLTASKIFAGGNQAAVLRESARSFVFGRNEAGQLGSGQNEPVVAPTRIAEWMSPSAYSFGASHTLAIANGVLYAAGNNDSGQLGNGTTVASMVPVRIDRFGGSSLTSVATGRSHSLALTADGKVYAWGSNAFGQLGLGSDSSRYTEPQIVVFDDQLDDHGNLLTITAIAAGENHSLALRSDGRVYAWGSNSKWQIYGKGSRPPRNWLPPDIIKSPTVVLVDSTAITAVPMSGIVAIAAGADHSLALTGEATPRILAWGSNRYGQLGDGNGAVPKSSDPQLTGCAIKPVYVRAMAANTKIVQIVAGENHSLARLDSGAVYAWGRNHRGQIGDAVALALTANDVAIVNVPTQVKPVVSVAGVIPSTHFAISIAAGANTSYAVYQNKTAFGWGETSRQQLGYSAARLTPIAWRLKVSSTDADQDGLLDTWEAPPYFQSSAASNGLSDSDSDGLLDIQEQYYGSIPANYNAANVVPADSDGDLLNDFADSDRGSALNAVSYTLAVVSGDNQAGAPGSVAQSPVIFSGDAPTTSLYRITASDPSMQIATTAGGVSSGTSSITTSASGGQITIYYKHRATNGAETLRISIGADFATANGTAFSAGSSVDTDLDGMADAWEVTNFQNLLRDGNADLNGDGISDRDAFLLNLSPTGGDPAAASGAGDTYDYDKRGWLKTATPRLGTVNGFTVDVEGNIESTQ